MVCAFDISAVGDNNCRSSSNNNIVMLLYGILLYFDENNLNKYTVYRAKNDRRVIFFSPILILRFVWHLFLFLISLQAKIGVTEVVISSVFRE